VDVIIYSKGFVHCSVCALASLSVEEITRFVNKENPTGLTHGWSVSDEPFKGGQPNPCPCDQEPETRKHYLFSC